MEVCGLAPMAVLPASQHRGMGSQLVEAGLTARHHTPLWRCGRDPRDYLPDIRDGLTHRERIVLQRLYDLQQERGGRNVPTGMLYGTVVEHVDMSVEGMQSILVRLIGYPLRS